MNPKLPEVWLRGPKPGIAPLLQPVAHALLQALEEVNELMKDFPDDQVWEKPAGIASAGFHLQHLTGVLDRLFTYAQGSVLSEAQLNALKLEGDASAGQVRVDQLVKAFARQIEKSIQQLEKISEEALLEKREVGRAKLPSTVQGLIFHAAEHTMRHVGQLLVTVKILKARTQV